ncbi:MAG: hypothetical protein ACK4NC_05105 [Candidatus Gracilibacteria bacterium]
MLASTAIFALVSFTTKMSTYVLHSFEGTNIAREGIEIMENIRGANLIGHLTWTLPETDAKWQTNDIFSQRLKNNKKVCILVEPDLSGNTPWKLSLAPKECTEYESASSLKDIAQKNALLSGIYLAKTTLADGSEILKHTTSTPTDKSLKHYGRVITLEIKSHSDYNLPAAGTSQHILNNDDILEVTSRAFWLEGGELRVSELKKIFTRWSTTIGYTGL